MDKKMILILHFLAIVCSIHAQRIIVTNDSLRAHFQKEKPYEVYDYYIKRFEDKLDYKSLYYDLELKNYLMKWLDIDEYIDYKVDKSKKDLYQRLEYRPESKIAYVKDYIIRELKLNYDSIASDTSLIKFYLDQGVSEYGNDYKKDLLKKKEDILPPGEVLWFHAKIAYPESYKLIKEWWYDQNKQLFIDDYDITNLVISLIMMNDPEVQARYDEIIKRLFKSDWHPFLGTGIIETLRYVSNAYAVKKIIELLPIKKEIVVMSDGSTDPFDYLTFKLLRQFMIQNRIEDNPFQSINTIEEMRANTDKIIEAAGRLIKKMEEEEKYWMENIPFDYVPAISDK
jgi:hypothetical protein